MAERQSAARLRPGRPDAIVSAGAPAGRWSAQSLTRPTRLQLLPTCGASQIREGVPLMGPLVSGGCKRNSAEQKCIMGIFHGNLHICRGDSYLLLVKAPAGSGGQADASERKGHDCS
ncbi:uncharacterized [Tachysurus ichikawai]